MTDIDVKGGDGVGEVEIRAHIPVRFAGLGTEHVHELLISARAEVPRAKRGMP
ncbi:hypothetical protein D3C83_210290 [compost metagenome]